MPLIKSANTPSSVSSFSMSDIEAHARQLLLRANAQAEQLLAAAQAEAEAIKKQAHADGRAEGLAEGKREGVAQGKAEGTAVGQKQGFEAESGKLGEAFALIIEMAKAFEDDRHRVIAKAESEILPLALAIARKLTRRLGETHPSVVESNLQDALRLINGTHDVRITIHPDQRELLDELMPRVQQQWPQLKHVQIDTDEAVAPGGCVVRTVGGEINTDLNYQLDRLIEELVGVADA